jgi:subtilisin-like proprotein convertase family protein
MRVYSTTFRLAQAQPQPSPQPRSQVHTYTSAVRSAITPWGRAVSLLTVPDGYSIAHLNVKVNISYPATDDLYIHLQAPDGTEVVLSSRMGSNTANMTNTVFDDGARLSVALGRGPFTGSYQPVTPLAGLNGKSVHGTWKLWVENRGPGRGTLNGWSLTATPRA